MKITISQLERAALATLFLRESTRGGSIDLLLVQDDLDALLGVDEFAQMREIKLSKMATLPVEIEIPDTHIEVLRAMLAWPGQDRIPARINAALLRRLVVPAPEPPPPEEP